MSFGVAGCRPAVPGGGLTLALALASTGAPAQAQNAPSPAQSAIPWLSDVLAHPAPQRRPAPHTLPQSATVPATPSAVVSQPLSGADRDATGLISSQQAGLPADMWHGGDGDVALALLEGLPPSPLPGAQDLFLRLVLSESDPPERNDDRLFLARIDALLRRGALDPAQALIERAGPDTPELFRRWFDISLLSGSEDRACDALQANSDLSPSVPARIFCLARAGRWITALVTLETANGLGDLSPSDYALLSRFLDPELFEGEPPLPRPAQATPLRFRLHEAIGEPLSTRDLPLAFAWSDLRFVAGWKSQLEAAERLARAGSLSGNRLLGLYTERRPAASGGLWERVRSVQALDLALNTGDTARLGPALIAAAGEMNQTGLEPALAAMFGARLHNVTLTGHGAVIAARLAILDGLNPMAVPLQAPDIERMALDLMSAIPPRPPASTAQMVALARAFASEPPVIDTAVAETILAALTLLSPGAEADAEDRGDALQMLRAVGQEASARQIAADLLLLEGGRP